MEPQFKHKVVCLIIPTTDAGGTENYVLRLVRYLGSQYYVVVWSVGKRKGDLHIQFQEAANELVHIPVSYSHPLAVLTYFSVLRKYKVETLVNFNGDFAGVSTLAAWLLRIEKRIVFYRRSTHAFDQTFFKRTYSYFIHALVDRYATSILSNSSFALLNFFGKNYAKDPRCKIIPNGIDGSLLHTELTRAQARSALNIRFDGFLVGHVGRIDPAKNHAAILTLAEYFKRNNTSMNFLFCGKDTDSNDFRQEVERRGIADVCWLLGVQRDLSVVYRAIDAFIFPSVTEGQPNALIEAMISGVPVIASKIEPIEEALPVEMHDSLSPPHAIDQMAMQLLNLRKRDNDYEINVRKQWAVEKFNHLKNFELVKNEL